MEPESEPTGEDTGLSTRATALVAAAAGAVALAVAVHVAMVLLYVLPENVVSERYGSQVHGYMSPELVQNWALFAPEPLYVNRSLHARARVDTGAATVTTDWSNLSAVDLAGTRGQLFPSHTRNQLRKGWDTFDETHDAEYRSTSIAGAVSKSFLKRVALMRLSHQIDGTITYVQLRSAKTYVPEPSWSDRSTREGVYYEVLPWWQVGVHDFPEGSSR